MTPNLKNFLKQKGYEKMKNLKNYIKDNKEKLDIETTSITLEKKHMIFVRKLNLNLSKLVRDYINDLINEGIKNEKSKK